MYNGVQGGFVGEKKSKILESSNNDIEIRENLTKSFAWSLLLYGCKTGTISKDNRKNLEAFKMWCFGTILKLVWI